jgi:hypothetical protein
MKKINFFAFFSYSLCFFYFINTAFCQSTANSASRTLPLWVDESTSDEVETRIRRQCLADGEKYYKMLLAAKTKQDIERFIEELRINGISSSLVHNLRVNTGRQDACVASDLPTKLDGQDITFVGGRCIWALKKTHGFEYPNIPPDKTNEKSKLYIDFLRGYASDLNKYLEGGEPSTSTTLYADYSLNEKLQLAKDRKTPEWILSKLAEEKDVEIRRAAAANRTTPFGQVDYMRKWDADAEVRRLAAKNLEYVRTGGPLPERQLMYFKMPADISNLPTKKQ